MRRARTVKPEFFTSEDVLALPIRVRLTFIGLLLYVDDYGNGSAHPGLVKAAVYPLSDEIPAAVVEDDLLLLAERGMITFYTVNGRQLLRITNWDKHQRVDRPSRSNIPTDPAREDRRSEGGVGGGRVQESDELGAEPAEGGDECAPERARGEGEQSRPEPGPVREDGPPSPFCKQHPNGTSKACTACGNARMRFKHWQLSQSEDDE